MKLDIQLFGGRGASSSETKKAKTLSNSNITSKIISTLNKGGDNLRQKIEKIGKDNKITIMSNRSENKEYDMITSKNTNTATIYSYKNANNKNDYSNYSVVGIIEMELGKWKVLKNASASIERRGNEIFSVIKRK